MSCQELFTKKYTSRPSPNMKAQDCKNQSKKGNDGRMYTSKPDSNDVYRWVLATSTQKKSSSKTKSSTKTKSSQKRKSSTKTKSKPPHKSSSKTKTSNNTEKQTKKYSFSIRLTEDDDGQIDEQQALDDYDVKVHSHIHDVNQSVIEGVVAAKSLSRIHAWFNECYDLAEKPVVKEIIKISKLKPKKKKIEKGKLEDLDDLRIYYKSTLIVEVLLQKADEDTGTPVIDKKVMKQAYEKYFLPTAKMYETHLKNVKNLDVKLDAKSNQIIASYEWSTKIKWGEFDSLKHDFLEPDDDGNYPIAYHNNKNQKFTGLLSTKQIEYTKTKI